VLPLADSVWDVPNTLYKLLVPEEKPVALEAFPTLYALDAEVLDIVPTPPIAVPDRLVTWLIWDTQGCWPATVLCHEIAML
jgi:hypothetical protein